MGRGGCGVIGEARGWLRVGMWGLFEGGVMLWSGIDGESR